MKIYNYSSSTGEFLGVGMADPNPLRPDEPIIPAFAVTTPPPAVRSREVAVLVNGVWEVAADYRGETWFGAGGEEIVISTIGIPTGLTEEAPILPPEPPPVPETISDRQFFQQLAIAGIITKQEALDAVKTGAIPVALQAIVASIVDDTERFNVEMILSGATTFFRDNPLTVSIGAAYGMSTEEINQFFRDAAALG